MYITQRLPTFDASNLFGVDGNTTMWTEFFRWLSLAAHIEGERFGTAGLASPVVGGKFSTVGTVFCHCLKGVSEVDSINETRLSGASNIRNHSQPPASRENQVGQGNHCLYHRLRERYFLHYWLVLEGV